MRMLKIKNEHDAKDYFVSIVPVKRRIELPLFSKEDSQNFGLSLGPIRFDQIRFEAAIWDKRPFPVFCKALVYVNFDAAMSVTEEDFSNLISNVLTHEKIDDIIGMEK